MPVSKAQQRATAKYMKETLDDIKVRVKKGDRDKIKSFAESCGKSLNSYIIDLIRQDMEKAGRPLE